MRLCSVRGQATDASGEPIRSIVFVPVRLRSRFVDARREIDVETTERGDFRVSLVPGVYRVHIGRTAFRITVPDAPTAELRDLLPTDGEVQ